MLALLTRVGDWICSDGPRSRRGPDTLKEGVEVVDVDGRAAPHATLQREGVGAGAWAGKVKGPSHRWRSFLMSAVSSSSLVRTRLRSSTRSPTWNTVLTLPASSFKFAFQLACAAASSSRTVVFIARIRCA